MSTEGLAPRERLPFLLDHFARYVYRVQLEPDRRDDPAASLGHAVFASNGSATALDFHCVGGRVERTRAMAETQPGESYLIYMERQNTAHYEVGGGREFFTRPGMLVMTPTWISFKAEVPAGTDFCFQAAVVPAAELSPLLAPGRRNRVEPLALDSPYTGLLQSYLEGWLRYFPLLSGDQADVSVHTLVQLVGVSNGTIDSRASEARRAISEARVGNALRLMGAKLHDSALSPADIAARLGISTRQLHLDFEETGMTFSRKLQSLRLDMARRLLLQDPSRGVTEIAFACGFESLSTFYRAFKRAFGMTASEFREAAARHSSH